MRQGGGDNLVSFTSGAYDLIIWKGVAGTRGRVDGSLCALRKTGKRNDGTDRNTSYKKGVGWGAGMPAVSAHSVLTENGTKGTDRNGTYLSLEGSRLAAGRGVDGSVRALRLGARAADREVTRPREAL